MTNKGPFQVILEALRLRLPKLLSDESIIQKIRKLGPYLRSNSSRDQKKGPLEGWENNDKILDRKNFLYISEIIKSEPISRHHNNPQAGQLWN